MEKVENMSDDRPTNKHTTDVSNNNGRVRGYVSDNNNAQVFTENDKNSLFPETTKFKITKNDTKTENKKTKED